MKTTNHKVKHHYQPTNTSCGYTALSILLSHYGIQKEPSEIADTIAPNGHEFGSLTAEVAAWCLGLDLKVDFYTFDFQIIDFAWIGMPPEKMLKRLHAVKDVRNVPALGKAMSKRYVKAYIDLIEKGAQLTIQPHPTTKLLYKLLKEGPVFVNVCPKTLHGTGRAKTVELRKTIPDDVNGEVGTHSVVLYGNDAAGNFLIADPWDGLIVKAPETVLCSIVAAQIMCDTQAFQVSSAG